MARIGHFEGPQRRALFATPLPLDVAAGNQQQWRSQHPRPSAPAPAPSWPRRAAGPPQCACPSLCAPRLASRAQRWCVPKLDGMLSCKTATQCRSSSAGVSLLLTAISTCSVAIDLGSGASQCKKTQHHFDRTAKRCGLLLGAVRLSCPACGAFTTSI